MRTAGVQGTCKRRIWSSLLAVLVVAGAVRCAPLAPPRVAPVPPDGEVVVFVPGITGSQLRYRGTGRSAWGAGRDLLRPRDGGDSIALPLDPRDPRDSSLEAGDPLERITLFRIVRKPIYGPVFTWLEDHGYHRGSLDDPRPGDTFFPFPYDWRRDNVVTAQLLLEKLEALRRRRGLERLPLSLICQSNGAHVCRYLAKYGGAELVEATAGRAGPPPGLEIRRMILVGTSNGGSLRLLRMLDRGRVYLGFLGRRWLPEALFTMPALYQDLPVYRSQPFLDTDGRPLDADLFDRETWVRFGLSVFDDGVRRRIAKRGDPGLYGDEATRRSFLARQLAEARELHTLLHHDPPGFHAPALFMIQNAYTETIDRAVVDLGGETPQVYFPEDPEVASSPRLHALTVAPGDEHATLASQMWLSPAELDALAAEPFYVQGGHFEIILAPAAKERLLEFLAAGREPLEKP